MWIYNRIAIRRSVERRTYTKTALADLDLSAVDINSHLLYIIAALNCYLQQANRRQITVVK